jgi:hypothetical protein
VAWLRWRSYSAAVVEGTGRVDEPSEVLPI